MDNGRFGKKGQLRRVLGRICGTLWSVTAKDNFQKILK